MASPPGLTSSARPDADDAAFVIESGRCEIYRVLDGAEVTIRIVGRGDVFGEAALLSPGPRLANVLALEDSTFWAVTGRALDAELRELKPWLASLIRTLAERFRELEETRRA